MPFDGTDFAPRSPVAADLWRAADILQQRGWCQCARQNDAGNVCVLGALSLAVFGNALDTSVHDTVVAAQLRKFLGKNPWGWNDSICTSKEQAVATLRRAALTVEAAHAV